MRMLTFWSFLDRLRNSTKMNRGRCVTWSADSPTICLQAMVRLRTLLRSATSPPPMTWFTETEKMLKPSLTHILLKATKESQEANSLLTHRLMTCHLCSAKAELQQVRPWPSITISSLANLITTPSRWASGSEINHIATSLGIVSRISLFLSAIFEIFAPSRRFLLQITKLLIRDEFKFKFWALFRGSQINGRSTSWNFPGRFERPRASKYCAQESRPDPRSQSGLPDKQAESQ